MVSRRSTQSVTQRSTRQSELHKARRPRRAVTPKTVDDAVGLSRKEERELRRALYASLYESRRPRTPQLEEESSVSEEIPKLRKSTRHVVSPLTYPAGIKERSQASSSNNFDESSQDSVLSSVASSHEAKKKVHAQRKFAQGCSLPSTPGGSPGKKAPTSPHSLLNRVPKTEDFLTFLCLRGSRLLPANLDYFNFARDESVDEGSSRPRTPVPGEQGPKEPTRESTPESSSSGSNVNEELVEITTPFATPFRLLQANRKAARASAGTPETARGIVSLRQGLTRKLSNVGRRSTGSVERKKTREEDSPDRSGSKDDKDGMSKDRMMACVVALSDCRPGNTGPLRVKIPETDQGVDAASSSEMSQCAGRKRKYGSAVGEEVGENTSQTNGASGQKGKKRRAESADGVFKVPKAPKFLSAPSEEELPQSDNAPDRTTNADAVTDLAQHAEGVCGEVVKNIAEPAEGGVSMRRQERERLTNRGAALAGQTYPSGGRTRDPSSESSDERENRPGGSAGKRGEVDSDGSFTEQGSVLPGQTDLSSARGSAQASQKQETSAVDLVEQNSEESDPPARKNSDEQCAQAGITTRRELMQQGDRLVKYAEELCKTVKRRSNREVSRKAIFSTFKKILRQSFHLTEQAWEKQSSETTFKMEQIFVKLKRNVAELSAQIGHFRKSPACSGPVLNGLCQACGFFHSVLSLQTGTTNHDLGDNRFGEQSGDGGFAFLQCICDVSLACQLSRLSVVCGEDVNDAPAHSADTDASCLAGTSQAAAVNDDIQVVEPSGGVMSVSRSSEQTVSQSSEQTASQSSEQTAATSGIRQSMSISQSSEQTVSQSSEQTAASSGVRQSMSISQSSEQTAASSGVRQSMSVSQSSEQTVSQSSEQTAATSGIRQSMSISQSSEQTVSQSSEQTAATSGIRQSMSISQSSEQTVSQSSEQTAATSGIRQSMSVSQSSEQTAAPSGVRQSMSVSQSSEQTASQSGIRQSTSVSQSSEQTVRKVGDPHRVAVSKVGDPHHAAVSKVGDPHRAAVSKVEDPHRAAVSKVEDPHRAAVSKGMDPHRAQVSPPQAAGPSSYNVYRSHPACGQGVAYTCMCGRCRVSRKYLEPKADTQPSSAASLPLGKENHVATATDSGEVTDDTPAECDGSFENPPPQKKQLCSKSARDEEALHTLCNSDGSQTLAGDKDEQYERPNLVKSRPALGAVNNWTSAITPLQRPSPRESVAGDSRSILQTKSLNWNSTQGSSLGAAALTPQTLLQSPERDSHSVASAAQSSGVSMRYQSNKGAVCSHGVDTSAYSDWSGLSGSLGPWLQAGVESRGLNRAPTLYPQPRVILSIPTIASHSGTFQPVEPDLARVRREARSSSSSAVRRVLEGASKKLRKTQGPETRQRTHKTDHKPQQDRSRDHRAKNRHKTHTPGSTKNSKGKHAPPRKTPQKTNKVLKVKPRRRSSLRLKTLAKILGRKRPNYSLVLSGYADMEEYEEEQKKKAAKSALARAKAEARARASAKQAAASKPRQPERMTTRSKVKDTDDKDRVGGAVKRSLSNSSAKEAEERRASDRDRSGSFAVRRSLSNSSTSRDAEEKKGEGHRSGGATLKRSLSGGSAGRKEQPALATIIETKRLKREGGREGAEEGREMGKSGHSNSRERKTVPASPQQAKKVTPKKVTPERPVVASSPEVGLSDLEKVPTFHPTEDEFIDPITYIDSIRDKAEPFGMCRIIPPASWKMESKVNDEIRFTTQIQHLHRLFNRWGPIVEQTRAIVHHLRDIINPQNSSTPQIGGAEVDLPQLYHMIRDLGGLQNIVDKKQWVKVADAMRIPKAAHDRVTRLYDVYCKFVLPFAMLNQAEREHMQTEAHTHYQLSSAEEDAVLKGKSMTLGTFSRIARNVQSMWFKEQPNAEMVEAAYWRVVGQCRSHVAVQCAHVNTRTQSTAFPLRRESPYFRHSWNLNNLPDNRNCILKCLGPVSGTTIPTLHVGMLFSSSCWSTDPHRLPYVQYLHTGANTVWYCIPKSQGDKFHEAMRDLCPSLIHTDPLWLSEDTAMVNPEALRSKGVQVTRCVQQPRQFVVVFPDVYTATVSCGYNVSESVHYATTEWLSVGLDAAKALWQSGEKELFSVDTLVCGLCQDSSDLDTLNAALPLLQAIVARELDERRQLSVAGLKCERRLAVEDSPGISASLARKRSHDLTEDSACEVCCRICYLSMVLNEHDEQILCLEHGLRHVQRKRHVKAAKLFYRYTEEELTELVQSTKDRVVALTAGATATGAGLKKRTLKKQDSKS